MEVDFELLRPGKVPTTNEASSPSQEDPCSSSCVCKLPIKSTKEVVQYNRCALSYFEKGDLQQALSMFNDAAQEWSVVVKKNDEVSNKNSSEPSVQQPRLPSMLDYDEGMEVFQDPIEMRAICHHDLVTAVLLYNSGQASKRIHGMDSAIPFYQLALDRLLPHFAGLGSVSPKDIGSIAVPILHNIGHHYYCKGDHAKAVAFYELALQESKSTEGKRSFLTGATLNCLGVVLYHCNEMGKSFRLLQDSLDILSYVFGEESKWVASVLHSIGRLYAKVGDFSTSLICFRRSLSIRQEELNSCTVEYGATLFHVAYSLHKLRNTTEALAQYRKFLHLAESAYPNGHRDIAVVLSYIGQIYHAQGDAQRACEHLERSVRIGRDCMSQTPEDLGVLLNRMGNFHFDQRNLDAAFEVYEEGLCIEQSSLEEWHPNITVTLSNIAEIHRQKGDLAKAINVYYQVLYLLEIRHGPESNQVAAALNVVGLLLDQKGDVEMAIKMLQQAMVIRKGTLGSDHIDVASTQMYLGAIYCKKNMVSVALRLFLESNRIRKAQLGENNLHVCFSTYNIGWCHQLEGKYSEAMRYFTEALKIQTSLLGENHQDVALTLFNMGETSSARGDPVEAITYFERALEIKREKAMQREDLSPVVGILFQLGSLYQETRKTDRLIEVLGDTVRVLDRRGLSLSDWDISTVMKPYELPIHPCAPLA